MRSTTHSVLTLLAFLAVLSSPLSALQQDPEPEQESEDALQTDIAPFARGELQALRRDLAGAGTSDRATQLHFQDAIVRIDAILDPS